MASEVPAGAPPDLQQKLEALSVLAAARGLTTLLLRDPATLAWLLGARVHVPQTLDTACFDVVVEVDGSARLTVVTSAVEAPRLADGELAGVPADYQVVDWWDDRAAGHPEGPDVGSDRPGTGTTLVAAEIAVLRRSLTGHQREVLRSVCSDAAEATTAACARLSPAMTEYAAAAALAAELLERGLDPVVLMVAGKRHVAAHRHPLPTTAPLGARAMLVCCARRHGLIASVTRHVSFVPLSDQDRDAYDRLLRVEAAFLDVTRAGVSLGAVVRAGTAAYARQGFPADEWHRHHQGGLTGWQPREFPAGPSASAELQLGGAVAWNPSAAGWKVEDTALVGPRQPELLVHDPAWPSVVVAGRARPDVLVR